MRERERWRTLHICCGLIYGCDFQEVKKLRRWATNLLEELGEGAGHEDLGAP